MAPVLALVTVLLATLGVHQVLRVRFVHALPLTVLSLTFMLYFAYIVGLLLPMWWVTTVLCLGAGVLGLTLRLRRQPWREGLVPSAPLATFVVSMILVFYFTDGRHVAGHDELRLWGAYPKLLFFDDRLLVGPDSLLIGEMQTYTPGLPLLGYFVAAFGSTFTDRSLFVADGLFAMALLAPLGARTSWRRPASVIMMGVGMALLPLAFANHAAEAGIDFYASLFSDPIVGLTLGYLVWLTTSRRVGTLLWCSHFGLALAVLYLIKTTGMGLGTVVLVLALARWLRATRAATLRRRALGAVLLAGPLALAYVTWRVVQARLGPPTKFDSAGSELSLDIDVLKEYVLMLLGRPEYAPGIGMFHQYTSFAVMNTAMLTALVCLAVARGRPRSRIILASAATLIAAQVAFLVGIYALVVGPFDGQLLSFPRYTSTMLTASSVLLALVAVTDWPLAQERRRRWAPAIAGASAAFLFLSFPLRAPITFVGGWELRAAIQADKLRGALSDSAYPEEHPVVTLLFPMDSPDPIGHHHGVYYHLLGTGARVVLQMPADIALRGASVPANGGDPPPNAQDVTTPSWQFSEYLIAEEVRFVVVAQEAPELAVQYADLFDRPPTVDSVYRVEVTDQQVRLTWVA